MSANGVGDERLPYALAGLPKKPDVAAETFFALDLRVGRVTAAEPFPEARKPAYKITADFGPLLGRLSSSAQLTNYSPEELTGRLIAAAVNLGPKRIAGFTSRFLVLGSFDPDGTVRLLTPEDNAAPGSPVA
ncbi:tRNA-binding protein [soil metagenome]